MTHSINIHEVHPMAHHAAASLQEKKERQIRAKKETSDKAATSAASGKAQSASVSLTKVALPAPLRKENEHKDYLKDLINAYCAIQQATGDASEGQMTEFDQLQNLDLTMSKIILANQQKISDDMKAYDEAVKEQKEKEDEVAKTAEISNILMWVGVGLSIALSVGAALPAITAAVTEAITTVTEASSLAVEGATSGILEDAGISAAGEAAEASAADASENAVSEEAADINAQANADAPKAPKWTEYLVSGAGKLLHAGVAGALGIPEIYQGYITAYELAPIKRRVADCQETIGKHSSDLKILQGAQTLYQKEVERVASTLNSLADELGEETETASDTLSVYSQITEGIGQRRA